MKAATKGNEENIKASSYEIADNFYQQARFGVSEWEDKDEQVLDSLNKGRSIDDWTTPTVLRIIHHHPKKFDELKLSQVKIEKLIMESDLRDHPDILEKLVNELSQDKIEELITNPDLRDRREIQENLEKRLKSLKGNDNEEMDSGDDKDFSDVFLPPPNDLPTITGE